MKRRFLLSAVCMVLMLAAVYAGGSGEEDSAPVASEGFVYDGTGPITDIDGQVLTELAQNSLYTTVDMREAEIVKKVQEGANVTIDWTLVDPTSYADAVSPMLASGVDIPDIVQIILLGKRNDLFRRHEIADGHGLVDQTRRRIGVVRRGDHRTAPLLGQLADR